ncbi:MAG TPA: hypothetical protein VLF71_03600 [Candidatus Saccharimonadales bacterium]|nr:hypothetical protein [Candidatus Saccharimonadales bacterium]
MNDKRYSVMILPRRQDGSILLQSWAKEALLNRLTKECEASSAALI